MRMSPKKARTPLIIGCSGTELSEPERAVIADTAPIGLILFKRNLQTPEQARALILDFKDLMSGEPTLILMDEEGGEVQRMPAMNWPVRESARHFGARFEAAQKTSKHQGVDQTSDKNFVLEDCRKTYYEIGRDLASLGANMDAAPCLDLLIDNASDVIGTRSFSSDPHIVSALCEEAICGLEAAGICPVIKHMPGHGRAPVDSHEMLPVVKTPLSELRLSDFIPFQNHNTARAGMMSHILYTDIDPLAPASISAPLISGLIRDEFGFDGLLMSDCLFMKALSGSIPDRVAACLKAGCDIALHCQGNTEDIRAAAVAAGDICPESWKRVLTAANMRDYM